MEALYAASAFATPLHLYVFESEETTPDAGSTAHLALYAASAFVIYKLIMRNLLLASWPLNPPAARGSHFREAAATAAERRAASRSPSPHHCQTIMESSNADASAAPCAPKLSTTRPPSRLQLNTGRPEQPHPPPTPKAPSQHHRTPAAVTAPARDCPPAARGSHFREAAAKVAERRAASQLPSPHHRQTAMESSNADASAAQCVPKPPTTRPPSRLQLNTGPKQPHPSPTPKAPSQHHRTPATVTAPACDWTKGWGDFGLEHLSEPERKRKRAQRRKRRRCEEKEELVCYLDIHAQITAQSPHIKRAHSSGGFHRGSLVYAH